MFNFLRRKRKTFAQEILSAGLNQKALAMYSSTSTGERLLIKGDGKSLFFTNDEVQKLRRLLK